MPTARAKTIAHHVTLPKRAERIIYTGLLPRAPSTRRDGVERNLRKIFDEEKPKSIQQSQTNSLFLHPGEIRGLNYREFAFETEIGNNALVADAQIFRHALVKAKAGLNERKLRELARKYWSHTITLGEFQKYYSKNIRDYVRNNSAPATMPQKIGIPEILYPHKIEPAKLEGGGYIKLAKRKEAKSKEKK